MEAVIAAIVAVAGGSWFFIDRAIEHNREHERLKNKDASQNGKLDRIEKNVDYIRDRLDRALEASRNG